MVCGSPNEVAPDAELLGDYFDVQHDDIACVGCQKSYNNYNAQRETVWTRNTIQGEDQLCQRMAWALYELLNVHKTSNPENTESNLFTYDIFLRHCFGSYFEILKETSYSPTMGEQFNFAMSASTRFTWDSKGVVVFPDENFVQQQVYLLSL